MFRAVVRRLIGPVARWAAADAELGVGVYRCRHGILAVVIHPFGGSWRLPYPVEEARDLGRAFLRAARDEQEGAPLGDPAGQPP